MIDPFATGLAIGQTSAERTVSATDPADERIAPAGEASPGDDQGAGGAAGGTQDQAGRQSLPDDPRAEAEEILSELVVGLRGEGRFEISLDEETNRFVYRAVDETTGEVIRQFPPETILEAVRAIREFEGLLVDEEA